MRTRYCRWRECGRVFTPEKAYHYYCCWQHRVADVGPDYGRDDRGHQRSRDQSDDRGFGDGTRARPPAVEIPPQIWQALAALVHPDRWQGTPALLPIAHEAMVWLLAHRPAHRPLWDKGRLARWTDVCGQGPS
jgi:hypothetical protein